MNPHNQGASNGVPTTIHPNQTLLRPTTAPTRFAHYSPPPAQVYPYAHAQPANTGHYITAHPSHTGAPAPIPDLLTTISHAFEPIMQRLAMDVKTIATEVRSIKEGESQRAKDRADELALFRLSMQQFLARVERRMDGLEGKIGPKDDGKPIGERLKDMEHLVGEIYERMQDPEATGRRIDFLLSMYALT